MPQLFANLPRFPPTTTDQMQIDVLNRYFALPQLQVVIVGTSLAWHLKDWYFENGNVRNMALPGESPLTGLTIVAATAVPPPVVVVETNILNRPINQNLVDRFKDARRLNSLLPPLRTLAAWYQGSRDDTLTFGRQRIDAIIASPPAPRRADGALLWPEWNQPILRDILAQNTALLKSLTEKLEARGVKVYFFEMPYPSRVNDGLFARTTRDALVEVIGPRDDRRLVPRYPLDQMRSEADGVHLDDRSSVVFAAALNRAISEKLQLQCPPSRQSCSSAAR
jgi:hypothetical protein